MIGELRGVLFVVVGVVGGVRAWSTGVDIVSGSMRVNDAVFMFFCHFDTK